MIVTDVRCFTLLFDCYATITIIARIINCSNSSLKQFSKDKTMSEKREKNTVLLHSVKNHNLFGRSNRGGPIQKSSIVNHNNHITS